MKCSSQFKAWNTLVDALSDLSLNFQHYGCVSFDPIKIPCHYLDFENQNQNKMIANVRKIINDQCNECGNCQICFKLFRLYNDLYNSLIKSDDCVYQQNCPSNSKCIDLKVGYR